MNVLAEMLTEPAPMAIWAVLMLLTLPALAVLASPEAMRHPRRAARELVTELRRRRELRHEQAQEAVRAARYAAEVSVAAEQAERAAERWQQRWQLTADALEAAWQAWRDADDRLTRTRTAVAFGTPWTVQSPAEYSDRERYLHRAVRAAVGRGELPAAALADAIAGRAGWDARLHPVEQELAVRRATAAYLDEQRRRAEAAERSAWHDAELAVRTRDSLRREAAAASARATALSGRLPAGEATASAPARRAVRARVA